KIHGSRPEVVFDEWRAADQLYYVSDTRRFSEATGWKPKVGVREGVTRLYHWLLENVDSEAVVSGRWIDHFSENRNGHPILSERPMTAIANRNSSPRSKRLLRRNGHKKLVAS